MSATFNIFDLLTKRIEHKDGTVTFDYQGLPTLDCIEGGE